MAEANFESLNFEISVNAAAAVKEINALTEAIVGLKSALRGLNPGKITGAVKGVADTARNAAKDVEGLGKAVEQVGNAAGVSGTSQIKDAANDVDDLTERVRNMWGVMRNPHMGSIGSQIKASIEDSKVEIRDAAEELGTTFEESWQRVFSGSAQGVAFWGSDAAISRALQGNPTDLDDSGISNVVDDIDKATGGFRDFQSAADSTADIVSSAMAVVSSAIGGVTAVITIAVKAATFLADQFNDFIETMKKFKKVADGLNEKFNPFVALKKELASLLALAKRQILRRAINAVIKAVTEGLREGVANLAEYDEQFSATMTSFRNAMGLFKNSIGVAVAPIISYFIPAINALLSALTAAMNTLARLTALLTGQHTYTIAKDYQEIGKSAGGASSAVKELQRTILGFDEINRLNRPSGSGGGGGGGAGDALSAYETMEVGDWPYDSWGEALLAFIQWLDGTGVPKLREGLGKLSKVVNTFSTNLADALSYEGVQDAVAGLGTHIGEALNNFLNGGGENGGLNWEEIGRAFGMAIKTMFNFTAGLITSVDFIQLGANIAASLRKALEQLDEKDIQNIADTVYGFLTAGIKTAIGFLLNAPWGQLGFDAATFLNRLVDNLINDINNIKWGKFWTEFEKGLNTFLDTVDWTALFGTATRIVSGIITALERILDTLMKNKEFMNALHQFVDFIVDTAIRWFMLKIRATFAVTKGVNIPRALLASLFQSDEFDTTESFTGDSLYDNLVPPTGFVGDVENATEAMDQFGNAINKTSRPLGEASTNVSHLGSNITDAAAVVGTRSKEITTSVDSIGTAAKGANTTVQNATRGISLEFTNMNVNATKPINAFRTNADKQFSAAATNANKQMAAVATNTKNNMVSARDNATTQAEALRKNVTDKFASAASTANTQFAGMRDNIKGRIAEAKSGLPAFNDVGANIKNGIIWGMGDFSGQLKSWCDQFKGQILRNFKIKSPSRWARDMVGVNIGEGISLGLEESTSSVMSACEGIKEGISSELSGADILGNVRPSGGGTDFATALGNQVLSAISTMDTNRNEQPIVCEVYLDRDRIASAVTRGQQAQNRRYSSTAMA